MSVPCHLMFVYENENEKDPFLIEIDISNERSIQNSFEQACKKFITRDNKDENEYENEYENLIAVDRYILCRAIQPTVADLTEMFETFVSRQKGSQELDLRDIYFKIHLTKRIPSKHEQVEEWFHDTVQCFQGLQIINEDLCHRLKRPEITQNLLAFQVIGQILTTAISTWYLFTQPQCKITLDLIRSAVLNENYLQKLYKTFPRLQEVDIHLNIYRILKFALLICAFLNHDPSIVQLLKQTFIKK